MNQQPGLPFLDASAPPRPGRAAVAPRPDLQEAFEAFDRAHPDVFLLFRDFASELFLAGRTHYGAKSIMERIRWHYAVNTKGETFKINNNYTSRYARKLVAERPEFAGFFETRRLTSGPRGDEREESFPD